ncbi:hypothetical protein FA09DRAFT_73572 [Tilletiopsis washingtonensis]|uniref:Uncharacterized protein n=1 Tax=Tilletiopsis washingtonensis TaxID=58919 RepID=A0A316Z9R9_9BASI|nr:hypothetical protein FA09DRAFT_73572 [Tilletiopsis washingtonensis]PWN96943.1 hypothetical protein FA09DRAFT_73572 [Tilletiopsis washingtonensis]
MGRRQSRSLRPLPVETAHSDPLLPRLDADSAPPRRLRAAGNERAVFDGRRAMARPDSSVGRVLTLSRPRGRSISAHQALWAVRSLSLLELCRRARESPLAAEILAAHSAMPARARGGNRTPRPLPSELSSSSSARQKEADTSPQPLAMSGPLLEAFRVAQQGGRERHGILSLLLVQGRAAASETLSASPLRRSASASDSGRRPTCSRARVESIAAGCHAR